jgi:hypothetical protein
MQLKYVNIDYDVVFSLIVLYDFSNGKSGTFISWFWFHKLRKGYLIYVKLKLQSKGFVTGYQFATRTSRTRVIRKSHFTVRGLFFKQSSGRRRGIRLLSTVLVQFFSTIGAHCLWHFHHSMDERDLHQHDDGHDAANAVPTTPSTSSTSASYKPCTSSVYTDSVNAIANANAAATGIVATPIPKFASIQQYQQ